MNSPTVILKYRKKSSEEWNTLVIKDELVIGRGSQCGLILDDISLSRQHLRIEITKEGIYLSDLNSSNGTFILDRQLKPQEKTFISAGNLFYAGENVFCLDVHKEDVKLRREPKKSTPPPGVEAVKRSSLSTIRQEKIDLPQAIPGDRENALPDQAKPDQEPSLDLLFSVKNESWNRLPIQKKSLTLGRGRDCDIQLVREGVSRHHACLEVDKNGIWLTDLGSLNGTQIGGTPIPPRERRKIGTEQEFSIGDFELVVLSRMGGEAQIGALTPGSAEKLMVGGKYSSDEAIDSKTRVGPVELVAPSELNVVNLTTQEKITLGRAVDNHIVLSHPQVSQYHALIERIGKRWRIVDLRSANGIYVNDERIEKETWLNDWDRIQIGPYSFLLNEEQLGMGQEEGLAINANNLKQAVSRRVNLLQDINLEIPAMEFVALVGMSGSGKTTLLTALSGFKPASNGNVLVNGMDLYQNYNRFRTDIGYVPQRDIVHAELSVEDALDYAAKLRLPPDTTEEERHQRVNEVLDELGLTERRKIPIHRLSGGQMKRVSIGVELLNRPRLFFLDEPTSGLDPGTEFEMMKLLRRLADQGRTIILVTHATKNVMLCDKVIFLARGGFLAFYGSPDDALSYFDRFRTVRERREKEMEFDDIYIILNDATRGNPADWAARFKEFQIKETGIEKIASATPAPKPAVQKGHNKVVSQISSWRQFTILTSRNMRILTQDRISFLLMVGLAPLVGLVDFAWGGMLYDSYSGDTTKIITMWWVTAIICLMAGSLASVREIVKESDIYQRERAVNLKILPYVGSKVFSGLIFALYSSIVMLIFRYFLVNIPINGILAIMGYLGTYFIANLFGYITGLLISAIAPSQNSALLLVVVFIIPQFLFGGSMPLKDIPGGMTISTIVPSRWIMESFIRTSGFGSQLMSDPCWQKSVTERDQLTPEEKEKCPCMGSNIFKKCTEYPGIDRYYTEAAKFALNNPAPEEPKVPTPLPTPKPLPTFTPLPAPILSPTPTVIPFPEDAIFALELIPYLEAMNKQAQDQMQNYSQTAIEMQKQNIGQIVEYSDETRKKAEEYAVEAKKQAEKYQQDYADFISVRATWEKDRAESIGSAEALFTWVRDNYEPVLKGSVLIRWIILTGLLTGVFILTLIFQKMKDTI